MQQADSPTDRLVLSVDPYPSAIQLIAFFGFIAGFAGTYVLLSTLFSLGVCNVVGLIGGLFAGSIIAYGLEQYLRGTMRSHRALEVSTDAIALTHRGEVERSIDPSQHINVLMWRFVTKRRSRVPKGWHVLSMSLEQEDLYIPVYTLVDPDVFEDFDQKDRFSELTGSRRDLQVEEGNLRLAGRQRRLLTAETARGIDGVEMALEDFQQLISHLQARFPAWMLNT